MGYALVFSGQGGQHPGMLPWLAHDAVMQEVGARLGVDDWRGLLADTPTATRNGVAQCLLTGMALAAWAQLAPSLPRPEAIAGYSVGELAAFSAAGVFDARLAVALAQARAAAMDCCAAQAPGGLLGLSQCPPPALDRLLAAGDLAVAIRNGIDSVVLGGPPHALMRAAAEAQSIGAHATRLPVAVASHTPAMRPAAAAFAQHLAGVPLQRPHTPLFSNAADRVHDADEARIALAAQIAATVRWDECMDNLRARGVRKVLEIGAGHALARLWNARHPEVPARAADEFRSVAAIAAWLARV